MSTWPPKRSDDGAAAHIPRGGTKLPMELRNRAFSTTEAINLGVRRSVVDAVDLQAPFHGVRMPADRPQPIADAKDRYATIRRRLIALCKAYVSRERKDAVFSHLTAAILHGLPIPDHYLTIQGAPEALNLHVSVPKRRNRPRGRGVTGHQLNAKLMGATVWRHGVAVLSESMTFCTVTQMKEFSLDDLVTLGDAIVLSQPLRSDRRAPSCQPTELQSVAAEQRYRGAQRLREAAELIRTRSQSARETKLRMIVLRAGLPEPELNFEIMTNSGELVARLDLYYPGLRLGFEYDGQHHRLDNYQYARDAERGEALVRAGIVNLRFSAKHIREGELAITRKVCAAYSEAWVRAHPAHD